MQKYEKDEEQPSYDVYDYQKDGEYLELLSRTHPSLSTALLARKQPGANRPELRPICL